MKLSIVIVNYNVKIFLEQCIYSVEKAIQNIKTEVFVIDNNSVDGSCSMIKEKFPHIHLIENKINKGFSAACNQAIKIASGEYILLLNPDTVIEENSLKKTIDFMNNHPDAGALGVKMINGKGNFLPESKRALPDPSVAFYKIFGLSRLFPSSRIFGKYHLGYLDENEINEVDILPGAFMLLRKKAIDKVGMLDENFFMYGEDIDISYRLLKEGFKNYYYPNTTIIHYKGESTKKSSINYVVIFYRAMLIFARKHFSKKNANILAFLINLAIYFRATLAIFKRFFIKILLPLVDAILIYLCYYLVIPFWENYKFPDGGFYPDKFIYLIVPGYILIWLLSIFAMKGYKNPVKISNIVKGILTGTILIILIYALLPESLRFSRALIFIGGLIVILSLTLIRTIFYLLNIKSFSLEFNRKRRIVIIGDKNEADRVYSILKQSQMKPELVGVVNPEKNVKSNKFIGNINQLKEIILINKIEEIIFCTKNITTQTIIYNMLNLSNIQVNYKIAPSESLSIIGSNSVNTAGDLYDISFNSISKKVNKIRKRLFDIIFFLLIILFCPLLIFFPRRFIVLINKSLKVLSGKYSWVGYYDKPPVNNNDLPALKKGVYVPIDALLNKNPSSEEIQQSNLNYARNYTIHNDLTIIYKAFINYRK